MNSTTDATVWLAIPALAPEGPTCATATTGGEVATHEQRLRGDSGHALSALLRPGFGAAAGQRGLHHPEPGTNWLNANPPTVSYGPECGSDQCQRHQSDTSLTVDGYIQPTTPVGYRNLTVTTGTQVLGINNAVYISPGPAVINSVSPNTGGQGVNLPAVQINGTNTHWVHGTTILNFPGVLVNSFTVNSPTSITANITVNTSALAGQV